MQTTIESLPFETICITRRRKDKLAGDQSGPEAILARRRVVVGQGAEPGEGFQSLLPQRMPVGLKDKRKSEDNVELYVVNLTTVLRTLKLRYTRLGLGSDSGLCRLDGS